MTVNFSYRAISILTLDLNGDHFSKWPPCLNIPVSKLLGKMILVSKYTFSASTIQTNLTFDLNGGHFSKWLPEYTSFYISVSDSRKKNFLNRHCLGQGLQKRQL